MCIYIYIHEEIHSRTHSHRTNIVCVCYGRAYNWSWKMSIFALSLFPAPTTLSSLGGLCDFEQSMCGWTHDPMSDLKWSLYSSSSPSLDLTLGSDSKCILIKVLHTNLFKHKQKRWEFWYSIGNIRNFQKTNVLD